MPINGAPARPSTEIYEMNKFHPKRLAPVSSIAALAAVLSTFSLPAAANMEALLEKLHNKGVLSDDEYNEMRQEAREATRSNREFKADIMADKTKREGKEVLNGAFKDGFKFETGDKSASIQLSGRIQADYRLFDDGLATQNDTFDIRRMYVGVNGTLYKDWKYNVVIGKGGVLEYAHVDYTGFKLGDLRVGRFKMPFSLDELTSSRFIDFQERSMAASMAAGKQEGAMIFGEPKKGFTYALAVSNGGANSPTSGTDANDSKDVFGRVTANFSELQGSKNTISHVGVGLSTGKYDGGTAAFAGSTEGRGMQFFSGVAPTGSYDRDRYGLEAAFAYNNLKLQGEYINTNYDNSTVDQDIKAYYVSALWLITGENYADAYKGGAFGSIKPNKPFGQGDGWGAWELGVRYSDYDASDFAVSSSSSATNVFTENKAYTIGLKWIPTSTTRVLLNYVDNDFTLGRTAAPGANYLGPEKALTMRFQAYF
jgi:phosphate-selective porin OprO/OprP